MTALAKQILCAGVTIAVLDLIWIGVIAKSFYDRELGTLARRTHQKLAPKIWPALVVYVLMASGIAAFVLPRSVGSPVGTAMGWGFGFGVVLYGVYDFTNYSILNGWSLAMTLADLIWGGVVSGLATGVTAWLCRAP